MINFLNFSWQDMHNSLFFLEKKSEIWNAFTLFEKWKVNLFFLSLISRVKSEMKMPWNRDREWKVKWKCLEIEIEKWNRKKILKNSRETRLSQVTALSSTDSDTGRVYLCWSHFGGSAKKRQQAQSAPLLRSLHWSRLKDRCIQLPKSLLTERSYM